MYYVMRCILLTSAVAMTFLFRTTLAANATCYLRTGDIMSVSEPCDPNAEVSHCCEKNKHICFSNKLCLDTGANHFIEGGCTDQTFNDPACPQYCKGNLNTFYGDVRQCDNSNSDWVCGEDPSDCSNSFTIPQGFVDDRRLEAQTAFVNIPAAYTVAGGSSPAANATATVTSTVTATNAPSTNNGDDGGSYSTLTVGLGAGLGVGLPLLIALGTSLFFLRRSNQRLNELRKQQAESYSQHPRGNSVYPPAPVEKSASVYSPPQEMSSS